MKFFLKKEFFYIIIFELFLFKFIYLDIQQQVIANLANFSYDPINFKWLRESGVIDIFLHEIKNGFGILQEFGIAGLCNLSVGKLYTIFGKLNMVTLIFCFISNIA